MVTLINQTTINDVTEAGPFRNGNSHISTSVRRRSLLTIAFESSLRHLQLLSHWHCRKTSDVTKKWYIYMYTYICIFIYSHHIYICIYIYIDIYTYIVYINMYIYIYIYLYLYVSIFMEKQIYIYICVIYRYKMNIQIYINNYLQNECCNAY